MGLAMLTLNATSLGSPTLNLRLVDEPDAQQLPPIAEIAKGPQPTRGAVDEYRRVLAVSSRENGQAARLALHIADGIGVPQTTSAQADFTALADPEEGGLANGDLYPLPVREVIPRDPAPEPLITLTL